MSASTLLSWLACGLTVGLLARFLIPGRQNLSLLMTLVLGIVGAILGGFCYSLIQGTPGEPFTLSENVWQGWIVATIGAVAILWAYVSLHPRRWWQ